MNASDFSDRPILAIDCCTDACSVALKVDGQLYSRYQVIPRAHSKLMLEMIDQVIQEAKIEKQQLAAVAVTSGPGAFTGVRLGVSFAQGVAFGLGIPVFSINTLDVIAQGCLVENTEAEYILAGLDARMGEVYFAGYQVEGGQLKAFIEAGVFKPEALPDTSNISNAMMAGTAWELCESVVGTSVRHEIDTRLPNAKDIFSVIDNYQPVQPEQLLPVYLRNEVTWKKLDQQ